MSTKSELKTTTALAADAQQRAVEAGGGSGGVVVQTGTVTLVGGVAPSEPAPSITNRSTVVFTLAVVNASTALGVLDATITPGVGFVATSHTPGTPGTTLAGDVSTYRYAVINPS
jgi:hypothetical protein